MIKLKNTACIEAPADEVWAILADLECIDLWVEPVQLARCEGKITRGVGAERVCDLSGGVSITERWTDWTEGKSFQYAAFGMPLVKRATNRWTLHPEDGKTLVTSEAEIELKGGFLSRFLEIMMRPAMKALGPRSLSALAYLVENGAPYPAPHRQLPMVPTSC